MAKGSTKASRIVGVVVLVVVICGIIAGICAYTHRDNHTAATAPHTASDSNTTTTAITTSPVHDGGLQFTVNEVQCGAIKVGTDLLSRAAQGQYCLVTLGVKNTTSQSQVFMDSLQRAFITGGTEVHSDPVAGVYANGANQTLVMAISPGEQVTGIVVFDAPKDTKITKLQLHGSISSPGVRVSVHQ